MTNLPPPSAPVQDDIAEFRTWLIRQGLSENTAKVYSTDAKRFYYKYRIRVPDWSQTDWSQFDIHAADFINEDRAAGRNPSSVLRYMASIRAYHRFLASKGVLVPAPFVNYKPPSAYKPGAHPLPGGMTDVDNMLAACKPRHRVLIGLCGYAGLRISEARTITPRSFVQDNHGHWWITVFGKGAVYREIPLSDALLALVKEALPSEPLPDEPLVKLSDRGARKAIARAGELAGVARPVASHDLRHTFASEVYNTTKDLRVTQELLGHASSTTTEGYTGNNPAAKREAIMGALS